MNPEKEKSEQKNCGESCGCAEAKNAQKTVEKKPEVKNELDPTHFGDWQVNCRAIDF
jgi:hypothetical protein